MAAPVLSDQDHANVARILNLPDPTLAQHPATKAYVDAAVEGLAWKDSARIGTIANINIASAPATIDGITPAAGDRVLVKDQTAPAENGIRLWNAAGAAMPRAADASTFPELEGAVVGVEEGTNANTTWRQTAVNGTLDTTGVTFTTFGTSAPAASTTVSGIAELATQAEVDTGTDALRIVTPSTLAGYVNRFRMFTATIGDGSATQLDVSHNFATRNVQVQVWETSGLFRNVTGGLEIRLPDTNTVRCVFAAAPASGAYNVVVEAKG